MDQTTQDRAREELIKKYETHAFESLANYNYYGLQYAAIEKQIETMEDRITETEENIQKTKLRTDLETGAKKEALRLLNKDVHDYRNRIKSVEGMAKKFWEEAVGWQEKGARLLEQVENFKTFKLKTPQEIAADKAKKEELKPTQSQA